MCTEVEVNLSRRVTVTKTVGKNVTITLHILENDSTGSEEKSLPILLNVLDIPVHCSWRIWRPKTLGTVKMYEQPLHRAEL